MQATAVLCQRLTWRLYFSIAGFLIGEILAGIPLVWPAISDTVWEALFWGGASVMAASSCVMVVLIGQLRP
jgi:hypothetical protein